MTALRQGLLITGIGMGLVFLMILALWAIMALLVSVFKTKDEPAGEEESIELTETAESGTGVSSDHTADAQLAAAAAVGVAMALGQIKPTNENTQRTAWNQVQRPYLPYRVNKGW
ncbi:MAG: OadG family protein [Anaerolineaceae bacterium]|jgi:Na+-transporting methylmalonyl-CoA/oxaloacetate decarboxylase gamma subunit